MKFMLCLLFTNLINTLEWNYNNNKSANQNSKVSSKDFMGYCNADYKFFGKPPNFHLEKLIVIFRHGDRAPIKNYYSDWENKNCIKCNFTGEKINNCQKKKCEEGELTSKGYDQAQKLGGFIKKNYQKLLFPDNLHKEYISYRVTKIGRTHSTLMGVMNGLAKTKSIRHIRPLPYTDPLMKIKKCMYLEKQMSLDFKISIKTFNLFYKLGILNGKKLSYFSDELKCAMCNNITINLKNKDDVFNKIIKISFDNWSKQMSNVIKNDMSKTILFGRFGFELIDELQSKSVLSLISAHDGSIAMILAALTSDIQKWPPYASAIFIELWCKSTKKYVRLIYNDKKINFDGYAEELIPLNVFLYYIYSLSLDDTEISRMCQINTSSINNSNLLRNEDENDDYFFKLF